MAEQTNPMIERLFDGRPGHPMCGWPTSQLVIHDSKSITTSSPPESQQFGNQTL